MDSLAPSIAALTEGGRCGKVTGNDLPPGHRALLMAFGPAGQRPSHQVLVLLDGNSSAYNFTHTRQDPADSTTRPRRTQIRLDVVWRSVILTNSGGTEASAALHAVGPTLLTAESINKPGETIARMVKECGGN